MQREMELEVQREDEKRERESRALAEKLEAEALAADLNRRQAQEGAGGDEGASMGSEAYAMKLQAELDSKYMHAGLAR